MRISDLLTMSINNLRRRKLRTVLTVLGVIIGTASIVVMVSLGIGLNEMTMEQITSYGSLTTIDVRSNTGYGGAVAVEGGGSSGGSAEPNYITDQVIEQFSRMEHVTGVSPVLDMNVVMRQGVYEAQYLTLRGVSQAYLEQIPLGEGKLPKPGDTGLVVGNTVIQQFSNAKTGKGYWDTMELPDVDFMGQPLFVIFDMDAYFQSQSGASGGSLEDGAEPVKPPKKYMMNAVGMVEGDIETWNSYSYYVFMDIDGMKNQLARAFRKGTLIPGQPSNKRGKALGYLVYSSAQVYVDDMEHVDEVQKSLADMGFQVSSQMDWLESSRQQSNMVQAVLGGIGAVSLFVAAIGIANTMMMSIYERTKEIGVMKVLGCDMGNIRNMFLMESGFIGLMGGMVGLILSYSLSYVMNHLPAVSQVMGMMGTEGNISRIPLWLAGMALVFAIVVGMVAGFFPAVRAMKLSPLAAIRNE